mgnify:CR=1 FL=1
MGLAYVHQMVSILGGTLAVQSTGGKGSRFTITLPVGQLLPDGRLLCLSNPYDLSS